MNPFTLLSLCLVEVLRIIAQENDKTRDYSYYIPTINLNEEKPRVSKSKLHFLDI